MGSAKDFVLEALRRSPKLYPFAGLTRSRASIADLIEGMEKRETENSTLRASFGLSSAQASHEST
jgi:hypothetical protein